MSQRPTAEEQEERIDIAFDLLSRCQHKSQIKKYFYKKYPGITARTVERYLSRAREKLLIEVARTRDDLRGDSLAFYLAAIRDKNSTVGEKIKARERIDRLYGLEAPIRQEHSIDVGSKRKELAAQMLRKLMDKGKDEREARASLIAMGVNESDLPAIQ